MLSSLQNKIPTSTGNMKFDTVVKLKPTCSDNCLQIIAITVLLPSGHQPI